MVGYTMDGITTYAMPIKDAGIPQTSTTATGADAVPVAENPAPAAPVGEAHILKEAPLPPEILTQTLLTYGYKATEENKSMLRLMLENGMPLTEKNIHRMNQALKLAQSPERALFMLQNNIRMTQANAALIEGFASGRTKISGQLSALLSAVDSMPDSALAGKLKQILTGGTGEAAQTGEQPAQAAQPTAQAPPSPPAPTAPGMPAQPSQAATPQTVPAPGIPPSAAQSATAQPAPSPETPPTPSAPTQITAPEAQLQPHQTTQNPPPTPQQTSAPQPQGTPAQAETQAETQPAPQPTPQQTVSTQTSRQSAPQTTPQTAQSPPASPLPQNLLFPLENSTPESITRYIADLRETLAQITQELAGREGPETSRVMQEVRTLESQLDFASQIRNQIFVQIPLYHDGRQTPLNLHVYKDGKKSGGGDGENSSALISLDTATLGRFETYVRKNSRAVQCRFRLENDETVQLVRENIHTLDALLQERGYNLEHFSFLPPGEPYSILDNPADPPEPRSDEVSHFDRKV
ncbi:MAG: flagellar hook-length control protein FliK [Defluviitaleaceae bacterium]|nr:flagellar hook-length control protein FliK [Defluviitaleaceae bacterium]